MCGIFGLLHPISQISQSSQTSQAPLEFNQQSVLAALKRRGPDDQGVYTNQWTVLGESYQLTFLHTRLSIIDLSSGGHQPMVSDDGALCLTFNGEIYNYLELKQELESLGQVFKSHSDTEVLLKAYQVWGKDLLSKLQGIFAFALWNHHTGELFMARDHFGVKPLYYTTQGERFFFSSEIVAILKSNLLIDPRLSSKGVDSFLMFGSTSAPYTILEDVFSLLPGHYGIWRSGQLKIEKYWSLGDALHPNSSSSTMSSTISYKDALDGVRERLKRSVNLQMRADVPVGVFLSGGIDSGLLLGLACGHELGTPAHHLQSFSLIYTEEGRGLDERALAQKSAQKFQTQHHEILVTAADFVSSIDEFLEAIDQPSVDGLNSFFVSRSTGKKLKVVLSGLGGDEIFAGYPVYHVANRALTLKKEGFWWEKFLSLFGRHVPWSFMAKMKALHLTFDVDSPLEDLISHRQLEHKNTAEEFLSTFNQSFPNMDAFDLIQKITFFESHQYMLNTLLRDMDAVSMHHSLEVRVPYLDHKLAEFVFSLPQHYKFSRKRNKPLLIEAFPLLLPKEVVNAPKKGFAMPIGHWMTNTLKERLKEIPTSLEYSVGIPSHRIERRINRLFRSPQHYLNPWKYFILDSWIKKYKIRGLPS